jgi:hypothetical protein
MTAVSNRLYGRYHNARLDLSACKVRLQASIRHAARHRNDGYELDFTELFRRRRADWRAVAFGSRQLPEPASNS